MSPALRFLRDFIAALAIMALWAGAFYAVDRIVDPLR